MKATERGQLHLCPCGAASTFFAIAIAAAGAVHASPSNTDVVVSPTDLPTLALYAGARLATFDVTENNAFTVTSPTMDAPPALYFGAIDTVLSYELNRMFDVKQVRAQMTRSGTGITFMLKENGLCDQAPGRRMDSSFDDDSP
jgi:hypothetical protein